MKIKQLLPFLVFASLLFSSCADDMDDVINDPEFVEINDFIYRGMNEIYLYKSEQPRLADGYFETEDEYNEFLRSYTTPENLFENLTVPKDRFSFITDDYIELENSFSGISKTTGVDYILYYLSENSNDLIGQVRYIVPGSNAEETTIKRGDLFTRINGEQITLNNYQKIFSGNSLAYTLVEFDGNSLVESGEVTIATQELTENPILIHKVIETDGHKIGYLLYNSFVAEFDDELNAVFAEFKGENIDNLILDLRYNGGGRVSSATRLASMITGQYTGDVFAKQQWNETYQSLFLESEPESLFDYFTDEIDNSEAINSLNLNQLYAIGTSSTASASELVMNGLSPYIDVIKVGDTTTGKSQASVTLYDSPNFGRTNANPDHTYAIQPLVYESVNANDAVVPYNGLIPDILVTEDINNLGVLGDPSEPLLAATISAITGRTSLLSSQKRQHKISKKFIDFKERKANEPTYKRMYIDKLPGVTE